MLRYSQVKKPPSLEGPLYNISHVVFNSSNNNQYCLYHLNGDSFCLIFTKQTRQENINKDIIKKLSLYASKYSIKQLVVLIENNSNEFAKIVQDLKVIGFESDHSIRKTILWEKNFKVLKMKPTNEFDDIEDVDF